ncbi:RNA ligase RtcB family protein [Celeribacter naphthalenivorans]|uniref:RNA ligase RtcB family protein n=1 Tax=Celeribacter naphthalenivorans TaxID=1614694 RepID=UPI001CFAC498|nr:RNA ligase RtcB family protein [Celeribacter naphthalenivorans]
MGTPIFGERDAVRAHISKFYNRATWIDGRAEHQLEQVAGWPGMQAVAGFPDLHPGRYGPVGAAFLADRIWPQLVGPDIGCGMALFRLEMPRRRLKLDKAARRLAVLEDGVDPDLARAALDAAGLTGLIAPDALGTLGGGNHFCEVQVVEAVFDPAQTALRKDDLCLLVHSGSRGRGAGVFQGVSDSWTQGFATGSAAATDYLALHDAATRWARVNRDLIASAASEALGSDAQLICDTVHNHVVPQSDGWLHRKGAACPDQGLVPLAGSRETPSFLLQVPDLVPEALGSVSHGAGRRYDRTSMHGRIRKTRSDLAALTRTRFGGRVICGDRDLLLEEAGQAYKDPEQVLQDLSGFGLAHALARLVPLVTFKTTGGAK